MSVSDGQRAARMTRTGLLTLVPMMHTYVCVCIHVYLYLLKGFAFLREREREKVCVYTLVHSGVWVGERDKQTLR